MTENRSSRRTPRSTLSTQLFDFPSRSAKSCCDIRRRLRQYATRRPIGWSSTVPPLPPQVPVPHEVSPSSERQSHRLCATHRLRARISLCTLQNALSLRKRLTCWRVTDLNGLRWGDMHVMGVAQRLLLRGDARRYAERGWRVMPAAALMTDRYVCGPLCPTVAVHPAVDRWESAAPSDWSDVDGWWRNSPHSVLLATGDTFDVIEVSAGVGVAAVQRLRTVPVAADPAGRWMFLVAPGATLVPELRESRDTVLHGAGSWIPAPPTRTPAGRVRWEVHPAQVGWRAPDARVLQQVLVEPTRSATFGSTTRHLRTAA